MTNCYNMFLILHQCINIIDKTENFHLPNQYQDQSVNSKQTRQRDESLVMGSNRRKVTVEMLKNRNCSRTWYFRGLTKIPICGHDIFAVLLKSTKSEKSHGGDAEEQELFADMIFSRFDENSNLRTRYFRGFVKIREIREHIMSTKMSYSVPFLT